MNKNYEENISDESAREEIYNVGLSFVALFAARSSTTPVNIDGSFQPLGELIHSALPKMLRAMTLPAKVESLGGNFQVQDRLRQQGQGGQRGVAGEEEGGAGGEDQAGAGEDGECYEEEGGSPLQAAEEVNAAV